MEFLGADLIRERSTHTSQTAPTSPAIAQRELLGMIPQTRLQLVAGSVARQERTGSGDAVGRAMDAVHVSNLPASD